MLLRKFVMTVLFLKLILVKAVVLAPLLHKLVQLRVKSRCLVLFAALAS